VPYSEFIERIGATKKGINLKSYPALFMYGKLIGFKSIVLYAILSIIFMASISWFYRVLISILFDLPDANLSNLPILSAPHIYWFISLLVCYFLFFVSLRRLIDRKMWSELEGNGKLPAESREELYNMFVRNNILYS
jgi:hypothetical protein